MPLTMPGVAQHSLLNRFRSLSSPVPKYQVPSKRAAAIAAAWVGLDSIVYRAQNPCSAMERPNTSVRQDVITNGYHVVAEHAGRLTEGDAVSRSTIGAAGARRRAAPKASPRASLAMVGTTALTVQRSVTSVTSVTPESTEGGVSSEATTGPADAAGRWCRRCAARRRPGREPPVGRRSRSGPLAVDGRRMDAPWSRTRRAACDPGLRPLRGGHRGRAGRGGGRGRRRDPGGHGQGLEGRGVVPVERLPGLATASTAPARTPTTTRTEAGAPTMAGRDHRAHAGGRSGPSPRAGCGSSAATRSSRTSSGGSRCPVWW